MDYPAPQRGSTQHRLEQQLAALEVKDGGGTQPGAVTTETSYSYSYKTPTFQGGGARKFAPVTAPKPRFTATGQQNGQKHPSPPPPPGPDSYSTILSSSRTDYNNSDFQFARQGTTASEDYQQHGQKATKGIISTNPPRNKDPPPPIPPRGTVVFHGHHQQIGQPPPPPPKPKIRPQYNAGLPTYKPVAYGDTADTTDDLPPPPPPPPEPETYAPHGGQSFPPPPPANDDLPPPPPPGVTYTYTRTETHSVPQSASPPPPPPPPAPASYEPPPSHGHQKYTPSLPAQQYNAPTPPAPAPQIQSYQPREPQAQTYHRPQQTTYTPQAQPQQREVYTHTTVTYQDPQPPAPQPAPASTYSPPQSKFNQPVAGYPPPANTYAQPTSSYTPPNREEYATEMYRPAGQQPAAGGYTVPKPSDQPIAKPDKTGTEAEVDALTNLLVQNMENAAEPDFFGTCAKCNEKVKGDDNGCSAMDKIFHISCFTCMTCNTKLRGKPFYALEGKAYCEECYLASLEKCSVCSKPIMDRILRATGKPYHPDCFTCVVCGKSLDGVPFTVDATNQIHCIEDFHRKFAPRCSVCQLPIMPEPGQEETVRIVAMDRSFHVQCYKCEDCGLLLSSDADGRGCYPLDDHILCRDCNAKRIQTLTSRMSDQ